MKKLLALTLAIFGLLALNPSAQAGDRHKHRKGDDCYRNDRDRYGRYYNYVPRRTYYYRPVRYVYPGYGYYAPRYARQSGFSFYVGF